MSDIAAALRTVLDEPAEDGVGGWDEAREADGPPSDAATATASSRLARLAFSNASSSSSSSSSDASDTDASARARRARANRRHANSNVVGTANAFSRRGVAGRGGGGVARASAPSVGPAPARRRRAPGGGWDAAAQRGSPRRFTARTGGTSRRACGWPRTCSGGKARAPRRRRRRRRRRALPTSVGTPSAPPFWSRLSRKARRTKARRARSTESLKTARGTCPVSSRPWRMRSSASTIGPRSRRRRCWSTCRRGPRRTPPRSRWVYQTGRTPAWRRCWARSWSGAAETAQRSRTSSARSSPDRPALGASGKAGARSGSCSACARASARAAAAAAKGEAAKGDGGDGEAALFAKSAAGLTISSRGRVRRDPRGGGGGGGDALLPHAFPSEPIQFGREREAGAETIGDGYSADAD